jgi:hypothetical protein
MHVCCCFIGLAHSWHLLSSDMRNVKGIACANECKKRESRNCLFIVCCCNNFCSVVFTLRCAVLNSKSKTKNCLYRCDIVDMEVKLICPFIFFVFS